MQKMNINNVQFSLLEASEDFMATILLLPSGLVTDRVGGAGGCLTIHSLLGDVQANQEGTRNDRVREHRLYDRINSRGCGYDGALLQFHDWRSSDSGAGRYRDADCAV